MAVSYPHESLIDSHQDGCTEPYIAEAVCALLKAKGGTPYVVELGGFMGTTSAWLALTLAEMGGGTLTISEPDGERRKAIEQRIDTLGEALKGTVIALSHVPSPQIIHGFADRSIDFAFVDNDHQPHHVEQEICNLWEKMAPRGIIAFHDVSGICGLGRIVRKYGGIALDLPKLGPDGGLGLIQVMH